MNVLFLSHQADFIYGGEVVTLAFLRELRARGVGVHFASPPGPYTERAAAFATCHEIPSRQFSRSLGLLPGLAQAWWGTRRELARIVREARIDVVHATSLKAMVYAFSLGSHVPLLWHHHDILPEGLGNDLWLKALGARSQLVLTPSAAARAALLAAGLAPGKVQVLRNGFRLGDWRPRPPRTPGRKFRVALVGEISARKGVDRLPAILGALGDFPAEFWVIGEGLSNPEFAARMQRELAGRVEFLGRREDLPALYQEIDLLLVPSRQDPLPTVIVEAGLSGVPVVAARVGGIPEMVDPGQNGYLFTTETEAAEQIRQAERQWDELARGARRFAEEHYDLEKLTRALMGHYDALSGRKTGTDTRETL